MSKSIQGWPGESWAFWDQIEENLKAQEVSVPSLPEINVPEITAPTAPALDMAVILVKIEEHLRVIRELLEKQEKGERDE